MRIFSIFVLTLNLAGVVLGGYKGSVTYGSYAYYYYTGGDDTTSWHSAAQKCISEPPTMDIAMLKSSGINSAVGDFLISYGSPPTWIGGSDLSSEGYWTWYDGTPLTSTFTNWASGEPNNKHGEDCLQMNNGNDPSKSWNDYDCGSSKGFVCQIAANRVNPSEFSKLTFFSEASTFLQSQLKCQSIGARLVQVDDDKSMSTVLKKMEGTGTTKFWVDRKNAKSGCSTLSQSGAEENDCNMDHFGFVCETAPVTLAQVSSEYPSVLQHADLEVTCTGNGYPLPRVAWYKDGQLVENQNFENSKSTLFIKSATTDDAGEYHCFATNSIDGEEYKSMAISAVTVVTK